MTATASTLGGEGSMVSGESSLAGYASLRLQIDNGLIDCGPEPLVLAV